MMHPELLAAVADARRDSLLTEAARRRRLTQARQASERQASERQASRGPARRRLLPRLLGG
jgi:hypothetical protein